MMNIIYDNVIYNLQKSGGISVYWKELTERIQKNASVNLSILEYPEAEKNIFRREITFNKNQTKILKTFPSINLLRYINPEVKNDANSIFHSSYYRTIKGSNIKNIVTAHDFTYEKKMKSLVGKIHIFQKKKALEKADGIICISKSTKKDMLELYPNLSKKKIKVVYNGFNSNDYVYDTDIPIENSVLFVGARKGYKNFDKAVEAVSETNNVSLTIVGAPLDVDEKAMLNKLLPNRYQSFSHVSNEELNKLYNQSICLLYLSEYEGFGIPVLEAMSAGCPVIALKKSSIPEVAGNAGLLHSDYDKKAISEAIELLRNDESTRFYQIKLGLENSKKFSWDLCYENTIRFYHEIITGSDEVFNS
jgi:mannosyltransferase